MQQVRCEVRGVFVAINDAATVPVVVLTDGAGRLMPIFVGLWEAVSINSAQNKEVPPRPFTHDLFLDLMERFSISVHHLQIDSAEEGVYYAQLVLAAAAARNVSTAGRATGLRLPCVPVRPSLWMKDCLRPQDRKRISPKWSISPRSCRNKREGRAAHEKFSLICAGAQALG